MLAECCFTSTETAGLLGTGAQDVHIDFHTAPELCADDVLLVEFIYLVFTRWELPQATHIFVVVFM